MSKVLKVSLFGLVLLVVVVGIVLTVAISNLDRIVKGVVESSGSDVLGTEVTLNKVEISLKGGSGSLKRLVIANPEGFSARNAFELDEVTLALDLGTVTSDEVVVEQVVVDGARVTFEETGGSINLQTLLKNAQEYAGPSEPSETAEEEPESAGPKLVIKEFRFSNAEATLISEELGQEVSAGLPDIVLNDIGQKGNGVTAAEAAKQVLVPVIQQVIEGSKEEIIEAAKERATKSLLNKIGL
jgi:uncharacterized protein involved in outer membrane biogenesis